MFNATGGEYYSATYNYSQTLILSLSESTDSQGGHLPDTLSVVDLYDNQQIMKDTTLHLEQIIVSAGLESAKRSPLRLKTVDKNFIASMAPGKTFPELIGVTPGIYATSESGSYGDAKINIRGYKQENISVLLNGIPISGLTSSGMYWNNWMGLADATAKIQVQKGIGASMLSDNSVGGTINIITVDPVEEKQFGGGFYRADYGIKKSHLSYSDRKSVV